MLSLYIVFMCHHIKPASVSVYLSSIANTLEPYFPNMHNMRHSTLVTKTLAGMKKLHGGAVMQRKHALTEEDLHRLLAKFDTMDYDNLLFLAMLFTGFYTLMCLGELTQLDTKTKHSGKKTTMHHTVALADSHYSFHLPYHKGDRLYEGSTIMVEAQPSSLLNAVPHMQSYLAAHDKKFPLLSELWLTSSGSVPTYSWFISCLQSILGTIVAGHSIRSGRATALTLAGVTNNIIQAMGCWASETFHIYIQKHPVLLQALIHSSSTFNHMI